MSLQRGRRGCPRRSSSTPYGGITADECPRRDTTGARLLTTLVHALGRSGGRYGMVTMCEGGGQANVTIIERA